MGGGERFGLEGGVDGVEKLWEVADVRRGIDGCWREDEIYGAHTLLGGGARAITTTATPVTLQVNA